MLPDRVLNPGPLTYGVLVVNSSYRHFVFSLFRLFAWRYFVFSSFSMASIFVFSPGVISPRKDEITLGGKTTRQNNARRKDENTPREKTTKLKFK